MNKENLIANFPLLASDWSVLLKLLFVVILIVLINVAIYDRFVQRKNQLLINYPLIGRMRYLFYMLRGPMRQYFGDETYYDSFEKLLWINRVAKDDNPYLSFSPTKPYANQHTLFKHANFVKEVSEVDEVFSVTFGPNRKIPYISKSVVGRSAMSDGAISPEGTRAFSIGAFKGNFPINTGEGGLTSNFLATLNVADCDSYEYLEIKKGTLFAKTIYRVTRFLTNKEVSQRIYRKMVVRQKDRGSFIFDNIKLLYFRIDWNKGLDLFPDKVPEGVPDITFQMGSGLYGVRDTKGDFDETRYQKVMRFARMTEIKLAQGAKQTGGKLLATKVSDDIAYYRGIPAHQDLISPNRFPYAKDMDTFFDFISHLQELSGKPVGFKIVISTKEEFEDFAKALQKRKEAGKSIADFITIDGGDGGSATAPLEMMSKIGLPIRTALDIATDVLESHGLRDDIKIIAAEKVLTPDDLVELFCYGADFINIARGFMISAGCIRARECSGAGGRNCPVGLATMDEGKRSKYLVLEKAKHVASYHNALVEGVRSLLAVMGKNNVSELSKNDMIKH
ncbi:FMN-binding glutamate synthase family protein [Sulfurovum sp.]|uniref:FMN-binding glutamate synthase family protein n=1 Tax=Sulfurovum sp. TaxID=1969726 RepID=UPI002867D6D5|nr:FMN-binding glutamate synthase family protein [Sulfurovum sp.]